MSELALIREAAIYLRERERYQSKKLSSFPRLIYWDADDFRLMCIEKGIRRVMIQTQYGYSLAVYPEKPVREKVEPQVLHVDGSFVVEFQFMPELFKQQFAVLMEEFGAADIEGNDSEALSQLQDYCRKVDRAIIEKAKELNRKKVKSVFQKICSEFGGGRGMGRDRLLERVGYFSRLASLYSQHKEVWRSEMERVGLL